MKKHNFYAGPSILSEYTIKNTADAVLNFADTGLSLLEISHRSKVFTEVIEEAKTLVKELLEVPAGYDVLFLGGGASMQFCMVPYNLLNRKAAYLETGTWAVNAIKEAKLFGEVDVVASSKEANFSYIPKGYTVPDDVDYFHLTSNNTIYGTEMRFDPDVNVPLVADMSSDIFSRPIDISKYDIIYAGAQKNMGIAGLGVAIIREDLLQDVAKTTPVLLDYKLMIKNDSMYNTPPAYAIYVLGLVLEWIDSLGGLEVMKERNEKKAKLVYDYLDQSTFYKAHSDKENRSLMNVTFTTPNKDLDAKFVKESIEAGMTNLKGHRSVGGIRASIYNAMPYEGVEKLVAFMKEFEENNR